MGSSTHVFAVSQESAVAPAVWKRLPGVVESYQSVQRQRLQAGERIQSAVQGRNASIPRIQGLSFPEVWSEEQRAPELASLFVAIRKGRSDGPAPHLGQRYRQHWEAEAMLRKEVTACLADHPTWGWLRHVKGVAPVLAAQLLARLDIEKAGTISSFWAYCGLDTVPGMEYRCDECGLVVAFPAAQAVSPDHARKGGRQQCSGRLLPVPGTEIRVAQPKPGPGDIPSYDPVARQICTLIGSALLKAKGPYSDYYRDELDRLQREKRGWAQGRRHATALRKTEKLFLAHLWLVWREAAGLASPVPDPQDRAKPVIDPWAMVDAAQPYRRANSAGSAPR